MSKFTRDDVLKLARLARVYVSDEEVETFTKEFNDILQYVEQLQVVDISGEEPTSQVTGLTNVTREDEVVDYGYQPADLLKNVPHVENSQVMVDRMIG